MSHNLPPGAASDKKAPWNQDDPYMTDCNECEGDGFVMEKDHKGLFEKTDCVACKGSGEVELTEEELEEAAADFQSDCDRDREFED